MLFLRSSYEMSRVLWDASNLRNSLNSIFMSHADNSARTWILWLSNRFSCHAQWQVFTTRLYPSTRCLTICKDYVKARNSMCVVSKRISSVLRVYDQYKTSVNVSAAVVSSGSQDIQWSYKSVWVVVWHVAWGSDSNNFEIKVCSNESVASF